MPDALSFAEIDGQYVELLPARTVLSLFGAEGASSGAGNNSAGSSLFSWMSDALSHQVNSAGNGLGGAAGSANAGSGGELGS